MRSADDCLDKDLGPPLHCNIMHFDVHLPALAAPSVVSELHSIVVEPKS